MKEARFGCYASTVICIYLRFKLKRAAVRIQTIPEYDPGRNPQTYTACFRPTAKKQQILMQKNLNSFVLVVRAIYY
jgi:hypothetical protein